MSAVDAIPLLLGSDNYQIQRSLRLRASATAYLSRTFTTPTNALKFTYSVWVKRGTFGGIQLLMGCGNVNTGTSFAGIYFDTSDRLYIFDAAPSSLFSWVTTRVFRDPSAWTHIFLSVDKSATAAQLWINGVSVTGYADQRGPTNAVGNFNSAVLHTRGKNAGAADGYFDGYRAEEIYVDGQYFTTPSNFGQFDPTTGVWTAKRYTGTYGANGDYTPFTDTTALTTASNVGIGKDFSGNGNYWVTNNVSISPTTSATYDSMLDVPLSYGTTDRGNYCTLNPLRKGTGATLTAANQEWSITLNNTVAGTIGVSSGKWYWEVTAGSNPYVGLVNESASVQNQLAGINGGYCYSGNNGQKYSNSINAAYGATYTSGDIIGVALDMDAGTLTFYKNNVSQGVAYSSLSGAHFAAVGSDSATTTTGSINFGQRPFSFTPPTSFKALHTGNLSAPTILKPSTQFMAVVDAGATIKSTTEAVFPSNFMEMIKDRANVNNWQLVDTVRGSSAVLQSNTTAAETTYSAPSGSSVGFAWKAGGAAVTNTAGSISAQVSANASAGFSIVTYTGTGANATVGHGLGVAPKMVIVKRRSGITHWYTYHASLANTQYLRLNDTSAAITDATVWNSTTPTSSVFSIGTNTEVNPASTVVAYVFAEVPNFSKAFSYVGNGSAEGPMVTLGFLPRWIIFKMSSAAGQHWQIMDTARDTYNAFTGELFANLTNAEQNAVTNNRSIDATAAGYKIRGTDANINSSGATYIGFAIAQNPFQYSLAR